jgi:hypothetical protein
MIVTKIGTPLTLKALILVSTGLQILLCSAPLRAQQPRTPHGVPPPLPNTPDTERNWERINSRKTRRVDSSAPTGRATLGEIKKDFLQIQIVNNELLQSVTSNNSLDYRYIADAASKIKTLAGRLNSNFALGKPQIEEHPPEYESSQVMLKASLSSLHSLVVRFVGNPIFRERGVFDIQQTKKAKQDVDSIITLTEQIKTITKRLSKEASK